MSASTSTIGYGAVLGRQASNLTTIAGAITGGSGAQAVTPASMTSIAVGTILAIDTASTTVKETVKVTAVTGSTFTAIFRNSHSGGISIALMVPCVELISIGAPSIKRTPVECTHMSSDNTYAEFLAGVADGGEIPFEGNYLPATASQGQLVTDFHAGTKSTWCVSLPNTPGQDNQAIWQCDGYVTSIAPVARVAEVIRFQATLKLTGKPFLYG